MVVMKKEERDILQNPALKEMPFSVPEGYFSSLEERLAGVTKSQEAKAPTWKRQAVYALAAAVAAIFITIGIVLHERSLSYKQTEQYADQIRESDIIEYLIYSGVELEEFEDFE